VLGQADRAVFWLRMAADSGLPCYPCFRGDRNLAGLRTERAFRLLLRELKAAWKRYGSASALTP
jgi:hypothetical protein